MNSEGEHVCAYGERRTGTVVNQERSDAHGVHGPDVHGTMVGGWVFILELVPAKPLASERCWVRRLLRPLITVLRSK